MPSTLGGVSLICNLCKTNIKVKYGARASAVPLVKATKNKELCSSFGEEIVLSDLLRGVGIVVPETQDEDETTLCRPCPRKIVNCCKAYKEIKDVFSYSSTAKTPVKINKRVCSVRTPTGVTPTSKRSKTVKDKRSTVVPSKKQLFSNNASSQQSEYDGVDDHISSLMNLPEETSWQSSTQVPPLVKVRTIVS